MRRIERPELGETSAPTPLRREHDPIALTSRFETDADGELCTIHPRDVAPGELVTTWISARDDAFVDLDEMR